MSKRSSLKRSYRRSSKRMHGLKRKRGRCDLIWRMSLVLVAALSYQPVAALSLQLVASLSLPSHLHAHMQPGPAPWLCLAHNGLRGCPCVLMHAQRDIMEDYQRSMGAWRKECARVRSEDAAADRAALLEHMKSAREICQQDPLKVYDDEMDKMQKTWQKHKSKLELAEKPVEPHMPDVPEEAPKLDVPGRGAGSSRGKREQGGFDSDSDGEPWGIKRGL
ncbi:hypothetical protein V8C86DRAFT_2892660, partial [Haematococcus lacustris]